MRKLTWAQLHTTQHSLNDVAVVAKQSSWLLRVMAMIGSYLPTIKLAMANCTLVILNIQESLKHICRYSSASSSLFGEMRRPSNWVAFFHFLQLFSALLCLFCFRILASLRCDVMFCIMKSTTFFYIWTSVVFTKTLTLTLNIGKSAQAVVLQICGPLFRGGGRFSFLHWRNIKISYA